MQKNKTPPSPVVPTAAFRIKWKLRNGNDGHEMCLSAGVGMRGWEKHSNNNSRCQVLQSSRLAPHCNLSQTWSLAQQRHQGAILGADPGPIDLLPLFSEVPPVQHPPLLLLPPSI